MNTKEFRVKCLEEDRFEEIFESLRNENTRGIDLGYFFISEINELFNSGQCLQEILDKAYKLYYEKLQIIPSDY